MTIVCYCKVCDRFMTDVRKREHLARHIPAETIERVLRELGFDNAQDLFSVLIDEDFDLDEFPPDAQEVTEFIRKMKAGEPLKVDDDDDDESVLDPDDDDPDHKRYFDEPDFALLEFVEEW